MNTRPLPTTALLLAACGNPTPNAPADMAPPAGDNLTIVTKQGPVHGFLDGTTRIFLGLPYAAPPTGGNRFRPPQPAAAWTDPRDATSYGPQCAQIGIQGDFAPNSVEDCLSLNVWAPAAATPEARRPVMVWAHGGGFILGSGSEPTYEGTKLSEAGDVVIVTINYRLGPLGFLSHPALTAEDAQHPGSGNYGLMDQQAALRWVQGNIAAFGGDAGNVTFFGESAGGISVCMHLAADGSRGLFQRAIMESGPCTYATQPSLADQEKQGQALAAAVGCTQGDAASVRACLRSKTPKDIMTALPGRPGLLGAGGYSWGPTVDGNFLAKQPREVFAAGKEIAVPLIVGSNADEGTLFYKLGAALKDETETRAALGVFFTPTQIDSILKRYPLAGFASPTDAAIKVVSDVFTCDARRVARQHSAAGNATYEYHFTRAFQWIYPGLGAFHSAELPFVWGNPFAFIPIKPEEEPLSKAIQGYWTRFAKSADPNGTGAIQWPAYKADTDSHLKLDLQIAAGTGLRKDACDFWDTL